MLPILIIFFTFCVRFYCATNSHVEHIMAFVLIPAVNQRPVLKLAYLCYHQLKLLFGAAWKSNIELFFFLSLTLILGLSIKTYIPVVWALEQFWDLVKYFLSKANPFRNINRAIIRRVFRIGGTSQSVSKASKGHKKPLNTWRCLRNVSSFSTLQEFYKAPSQSPPFLF